MTEEQATERAKTLMQLLINTGAEFEDEKLALQIIIETLKSND